MAQVCPTSLTTALQRGNASPSIAVSDPHLPTSMEADGKVWGGGGEFALGNLHDLASPWVLGAHMGV